LLVAGIAGTRGLLVALSLASLVLGLVVLSLVSLLLGAACCVVAGVASTWGLLIAGIAGTRGLLVTLLLTYGNYLKPSKTSIGC